MESALTIKSLPFLKPIKTTLSIPKDIMRDVKEKVEEKWKPEVLVLGPGGIKGFAIIGVISVLEKSGIIKEINNYIGVSVGSIISLLIIVGMKVKDIIKFATENDILKIGMTNSIEKVKENGGIISTDAVRKILGEEIYKSLGCIPSLNELYKMTGKSLITVALNVTKQKKIYFSKDNYPDLSCVDAVIYSMSIPVLFWKSTLGEDLYVDGALADPYPINYMDDGKRNILGIRIHTEVSKKLTVETYFSIILDAHILVSVNDNIERASSRCRHIVVHIPYANVVGISVSAGDKISMTQIGEREGEGFAKEVGWL